MLNQTIPALHQQLLDKQLTIEDLVLAVYERIEAQNHVLNALITVRDKAAVLAEAREKQHALDTSAPMLYGMPFVLKDGYSTKDILTTAASNVLAHYVPPYNATVYQKLLDAGAILIGKANMDAWGHGGTTENTDFNPTKNPYDVERVAGGSSGGCAVAVASGMCVFAIGEDTGGSIRNPAAWTNTSGLKVTYGRVSRYGTIAYASSFDTVGPMAKTVIDCAHVLECIAGHDAYDATSSTESVDDYSTLLDLKAGKVIGVPRELLGEGLDAEMRTLLERQLGVFSDMGFEIRDVSMPLLSYGLSVYYLIGPSETSSNLGRYDGVRYGDTRDAFTEETMRRIMIGTYALSAGYYDAYYRQAQKVRTLLIEEYRTAFEACDVLFMPVNPTPPPMLGELMSDPLANMLADMYTTTQNPAGVPSLALPAGFTDAGLPVGMQLVGPMFSERMLLSIGARYQEKVARPIKVVGI